MHDRRVRFITGVPMLMALLLVIAACGNLGARTGARGDKPAEPLAALDHACITPEPAHSGIQLTIAQQSVSRSGIWRVFPGWTVPVGIDGSYRVRLEVPTTGGYEFSSKAFGVRLESTQWRIAAGSENLLPSADNVSPVVYEFILVPTQPEARPGTASSTPPSSSMIRLLLEGVVTPDKTPVAPFVMRVVDLNETMPTCPRATIPNI